VGISLILGIIDPETLRNLARARYPGADDLLTQQEDEVSA
jgi:hypothetical protein